MYQVFNKNLWQFELYNNDNVLVSRKPFPYENVTKRKFHGRRK